MKILEIVDLPLLKIDWLQSLKFPSTGSESVVRNTCAVDTNVNQILETEYGWFTTEILVYQSQGKLSSS